MGTRGFVFICYRGRYYIYYNQYDSYPEGLGEAIIQEIPTDPEKYREWLESMRGTYSRLNEQVEEQKIPVHIKIGQENITVSERYANSFLAVDDRLEAAPTQALLPEFYNDLFIEWTYTIDLDREVLAVDDAAYFKLSNIPRKRRWIKYIDLDARGRRVLSRNTPEEIIGDITWKPDVNSKSLAAYKSLSITMVAPNAFVHNGPLPRTYILSKTFSFAASTYRKLLDRFGPTWAPDSFIFRELAFALLSLAAGEVAFESPQVLNGNYKAEGYFLIPEPKLEKNQQKLLPRFLYENHLQGVETGSAPTATAFWFGGVFVYLTSRLDLVDVEEASVAEVVNAGFGRDAKNFYAVVFSILDVILIRVQVKKDGNVHIERSPLMNLFYFDDKCSEFAKGPRSRASQFQQSLNKEEKENTKRLSSVNLSGSDNVDHPVAEENEEKNDEKNDENATDDKVRTFLAMVHFFNAAADKRLAGTKSLVFPNEILTTVMEYSDIRTYQTLAKVSACCREFSYRKFRLNNHYTVVGICEKNEHIVLEDLHSGYKINSELGYYRDHWSHPRGSENKQEMRLNPVIGISDASRVSILDSVTLTLSNVTPKDPLYLKKVDAPAREQHYFMNRSREEDHDKLFNVPDYVYPGYVETAWGRYLMKLIQEIDNHSSVYSFVVLRSASYRCLLPPRYNELSMEHFHCSGLQAYVRYARDETPQEWKKTLQYAVRQLSIKESAGEYGERLRGRPVIVAFTTRMKLFYYVHQRADRPTVPPTASSHSVEIASRCTDPEPRRRLVQLIPGDEPIDLKDSEARAKFEEWIRLLRGTKTAGFMEYDPITEEHVPITKDEEKTENRDEVEDENGDDEEESEEQEEEEDEGHEE